jgi:hypothetical protein
VTKSDASLGLQRHNLKKFVTYLEYVESEVNALTYLHHFLPFSVNCPIGRIKSESPFALKASVTSTLRTARQTTAGLWIGENISLQIWKLSNLMSVAVPIAVFFWYIPCDVILEFVINGTLSVNNGTYVLPSAISVGYKAKTSYVGHGCGI